MILITNLNNSTPISKPPLSSYEDGKIDGVEQVFIIDGKGVPEKEIFRRPWSWSEGICHQLAQKHACGHGPFGVDFHEVSISLSNVQYSQFFFRFAYCSG